MNESDPIPGSGEVIPLEEIHERLNEMLLAVDELCRRHSLRYTLYVGTLLGVVRDGDFIAWDDDADLAMPLSDFRIFQKIAEQELPKKYVVQHPDNCSDHLAPWIRIYCDGTTFMHRKWAWLGRHKGLFLDIYPLIGAYDNPLRLKLQQITLRVYEVLLRADTRRYQYYKKSPWYKDAIGAAVSLVPRVWRWQVCRVLLRAVMLDPSRAKYVCTLDAARFVPKYREADWREFITMPLRGHDYPVPAKYDTLLRLMYGDYMTPPPVSERMHHILAPEELIVDLHRNYTEYEREIREQDRKKRRKR